jgi:lysophospholipase L1-like esterase
VETSASIGRTTADGVAEITSRGPLPPVLVISLGTNDDPSAVSTFAGQIEAVLQAAGPGGCVVWPSIVRPPYNGVSYRGYNRALAAAAAANPNLIVVDWVGMVASNPGWMARDGVHASPEGYAARGQAIAAAVLGCGAGSVAPLGD